MRARGLKLIGQPVTVERSLSRPVRARGLKRVGQRASGLSLPSRPVRARGLKRHPQGFGSILWLSRPVRARGLKRFRSQRLNSRRQVAPRAGAWIETPSRSYTPFPLLSRPVRARGLKRGIMMLRMITDSRAPCGRVD